MFSKMLGLLILLVVAVDLVSNAEMKQKKERGLDMPDELEVDANELDDISERDLNVMAPDLSDATLEEKRFLLKCGAFNETCSIIKHCCGANVCDRRFWGGSGRCIVNKDCSPSGGKCHIAKWCCEGYRCDRATGLLTEGKCVKKA